MSASTTVIDCPNCRSAGERASHGGFSADCVVCDARRISRGPIFADASDRGEITNAYKAQLCAIAGDMHWHAIHKLVRAWQRGERPAWP